MKKNYKTFLILVFLLLLLTLYLVNPNLITKNILIYTNLFFTKLFPTNFIMLTLAELLINYNIIYYLSFITKNNSSIIYILLISLICGFPSGPKTITNLYKLNYIDKLTANNLLKYMHFPNPLFVLGPIKILLNNKFLATSILLSIYISNFIIFIFSKKHNHSDKILLLPENNFNIALEKAIFKTIKLEILIYGTSVFFYLLSEIIKFYIRPHPYIYVLINGIFDLTKGIFSTSIFKNNITSAYFILLFLSFGSISIHMQIKSILMDANISYKCFFIGRIISTLLSIIILTLFLYLF